MRENEVMELQLVRLALHKTDVAASLCRKGDVLLQSMGFDYGKGLFGCVYG